MIFYFHFSLALLNRGVFLLHINCWLFTVNKMFFCPLSKLVVTKSQITYSHICAGNHVVTSSRIILSYVVKNNPGSFLRNPHSMIGVLSCVITDESHWAMESPIWFLTLFGGIWLLPIIYFKHLNSFSRKLLIVGCIYLSSIAHVTIKYDGD